MVPLALASAESYVAGAYLAFLVLILVYVAIMAGKLQRIQRQLGELAALAEDARGGAEPSPAAVATAEDVPAAGGRS